MSHDEINPQILKFIRAYGITSGNLAVYTNTIYYGYCLWRGNEKRLSQRQFTQGLSKLFELETDESKGKYFRLSNYPIKLLPETNKDMRDVINAPKRKSPHGKEKKQ